MPPRRWPAWSRRSSAAGDSRRSGYGLRVTGELPTLAWEPAAERSLDGYEAVDFDWLKRSVIEPARRSGAERTTLANPAQAWLDRVAALDALAVRGVRLRTLEDLSALHGYVLEPAWRAGVEAPGRVPRAAHAARRAVLRRPGASSTRTRSSARCTRRRSSGAAPRRRPPPGPPGGPRREQVRAVATHEGTVQIIAPAGSGKTTVLIERVRELLRRGVRRGAASSPRPSTATRGSSWRSGSPPRGCGRSRRGRSTASG